MRKMILVLAAAVLFSCKKEETALTRAAIEPPPPPASVAQTSEAGRAADLHDQKKPAAAVSAPLDRMIIRNATVTLIVRDTAKAIDAITAAIEGSGGYISASSVWRENDVLRGKLTLRIPNGRLSTAMAAIRASGVRVQSESVSSEEVTQEYVDLTSQVRNLEATEEELRQLLATVRERAKKASDILEVHEQLMTIRGEIEQAKGRMRYLEQMTSLATISVDLVPDAVATPAVEPGWQPLASVKEATRSLTNAGKAFVNAAIWIAIYVIPMLVFFAIFAFAIWKLLAAIARSSRRRLQS